MPNIMRPQCISRCIFKIKASNALSEYNFNPVKKYVNAGRAGNNTTGKTKSTFLETRTYITWVYLEETDFICNSCKMRKKKSFEESDKNFN